MSFRSVLIIGGDGTIGRELARRLDGDHIDWYLTTRRRKLTSERRILLDLADPPADWPELPAVEVAYLCAGVTLQAACQRDPQGTALINVERTLELANRLRSAGAFLVVISTNLVFEGTEPLAAADRPVSPITEYGRQKAAIEQALLAAGHGAAVVRLGKVLPTGYSLFQTWKEQLAAGETIHPFHDLRIAPLPLEFVGDLLLQVGRRRFAGIVQATADQDVSYAEIARRLANRVGADAALVQPDSVAAIRPDLLPIPRHSTLRPFPDLAAWGLTIPPVWTTIEAAG